MLFLEYIVYSILLYSVLLFPLYAIVLPRSLKTTVDIVYPQSCLYSCSYGRLGRDVCRDGTFFIPALKTVYMGGATGCLPGRFSSWVHVNENVSSWNDFTRDNLQSQHNIVPAKRDGEFI